MWRVGELESWRVGELESWRVGESVVCLFVFVFVFEELS